MSWMVGMVEAEEEEEERSGGRKGGSAKKGTQEGKRGEKGD